MDGLEVLRTIRKDEWGKDASVIILTNLSDNQRMAEAMGLGAYEYLVKGQLNIEDVVLIIKNKLKKF
jgi:DNA-binding response OmpR family regulator